MVSDVIFHPSERLADLRLQFKPLNTSGEISLPEYDRLLRAIEQAIGQKTLDDLSEKELAFTAMALDPQVNVVDGIDALAAINLLKHAADVSKTTGLPTEAVYGILRVYKDSEPLD